MNEKNARNTTPAELLKEALIALADGDEKAGQGDLTGAHLAFETAQAKALVAIANLLAEQWGEQ